MIGDFLVDTPNPRALDATLQQLGAVLVGGPNYTQHEGHYIVRPLPASRGDFLIFACTQQGYCKVIGPAPDPAPWDVPNATAGYLERAGVWVVLDLIASEFRTDPMSVQCFDRRLVDRAIQLAESYRAHPHQLEAALQTVLEGFRKGVFVRDTSRDDEPGWGVKLLPYVHALAVLQEHVGEPRLVGR